MDIQCMGGILGFMYKKQHKMMRQWIEALELCFDEEN